MVSNKIYKKRHFKLKVFLISLLAYVFFNPFVFATRLDNSYQESPLHSAVFHGDFEKVKNLVAQGKDVNEIGKRSGNTPLHWAFTLGRADLVSFNLVTGIPKLSDNFSDNKHKLLDYIKIVELLIQNGADANLKNDDGETPLLLAASKGVPAMVEILIKQGQANIHIGSEEDQTTPLHASKNSQITKLLIDAGADVHSVDLYGRQPLHFAKDAEMTRLLIEAGAEVNSKDNEGWTPLHFAKNTKIAEVLIEAGANIHARTKTGEELWLDLRSIGYKRNYILVETLEDEDFDSELTERDELTEQEEELTEKTITFENKNQGIYKGETPLFFAVKDSHYVKLLIDAGVDVNIRSDKGLSPLHFAAYFGNLKSVKFLIEAGAELNVKDQNGLTPLHQASNQGRLKVMDFLIQAGANIFAQDHEGRNLFHVMNYRIMFRIQGLLKEHGYSIEEISEELAINFIDQNITSVISRIVQSCIQKGLDLNQQDKKGRTAFHYFSSQSFNFWLLNFFIHSGIDLDINIKDYQGKTPLHILTHSIVLRNPIVMPQLFLFAGADVNNRDNEGKAPLHFVNNFLTAESLLSAGADINNRDNEGRTPLYYVNNFQIAEVFVSAGADLNNKDNKGKTPLHFVSNFSIAKLFLSAGADVNSKDNRGNTPLYYVKDEDIAEILIFNGATK